MLDGHGRVLAFLRTIVLEDGGVLLDGEPASDAGISWLAQIAPLSGCGIDRTPFGVVTSDEAEDTTSAIASGPRMDGLAGIDLVVAEPGDVDPLPRANEAERIAAGWPRYGVDVTADDILNDTPLLEIATSFTKGCYRGQETVAKINNLGRPRRGFARARIEGDGAPPAGTQIVRDGAEVGRVTSSAAHEGGVVAIAVVRSEHREADVTVDGRPATLVPIVLGPPPAPPPPPSARPRLGRRVGGRR